MSEQITSPTVTLVVLGEMTMDLRPSVTLPSIIVDELILIANPGMRWGGYGALANHFLDQALGDIFGMIHADTVLSPEVTTHLVQSAVGGAVSGIVGKAIGGKETIWSAAIPQPTPVSTLDGCAWFVSLSTVRQYNLRFDVGTFDGFHCCVEDFCLQASTRGVPILVVPGNAGHPLPLPSRNLAHTPPGGQWPPGAHNLYWTRLNQKWAHVQFWVT